MSFDHSGEQSLLRDSVLEYALRNCPYEKLHEIFDSESGFDDELWSGLLELGVAGLAVSEDYDGDGFGLAELVVTAEALGHAAFPGPFLGQVIAALAIEAAGSEDQKKRWLPALIEGEKLAGVAWAEAGSRWQPEQWTLSGNGALSGEKLHVLSGDRADLLVVGLAGGELALVESSADSLQVEEIPAMDRTRRIHRVSFDGADFEMLPDGANHAGRVRDAALILIAADAVGGAQRAVEMSVNYAKEREQFGVPIGQFQGLKFQLANMAAEAEPGWALVWRAADAFDRGASDAGRLAALAKARTTEVYLQISRDATEAHGGIGFTWEYDVQFYLKRAIFDHAFLGAPSVHYERAADLASW
jgi:alkylation response protein AidB-like acyl-CoA dehydrogenase